MSAKPIGKEPNHADIEKYSALLAEALGRDYKPPEARLQAIELSALIDLELEPPRMMAGAVIKPGSLIMWHAPAGVGKTYLGIGLAVHLSHGVDFLGWRIPTPEEVMLIDGEMSAFEIQKRFASIALPIRDSEQVARREGPAPFKPCHIITPDLLEQPIRKIDSPEGVADLMDLVSRYPELRLLILDNLSALTAPDDDNSAASWSPIQDLLLMLRRRNIATVLVHHSGKGGAQRGTSRRADILDVVLKLESDIQNVEQDGKTRIVVTFEKGRSMSGEQKQPFTAILEPSPDGKGLMWTRSAEARPLIERVRSMLLTGMSPGDIVAELNCGRSYVYRIKDGMADELAEHHAKKRGRRGKGEIVPFRPSLNRGGGDTAHDQ